MFVDRASIHCLAGSGGNGCNSHIRSRNMKYPKPTGGDGGNGGSVFLKASKDVHTLLDLQMKKTFRGGRGKHGGSNNMTGAEGTDLCLNVPLGTEIYDAETDHLLADLCEAGTEVKVSKGGAGGKGNNRRAESTPGHEGETKTIRLELKLIADVGIVGFPNAGKSTLISHVTNAKSRIAAFPFTTKAPVLGVVKSDYGDALVVADIPGLIEGAHEGRGLGDRFLRHVERTRMFLHIIDMAAVEGRDPVEDFHVIENELKSYSSAFAQRESFLVANKMDVPEAEANLVKFRRSIKQEIFGISAVTGAGLKELVLALFKRLNR